MYNEESTHYESFYADGGWKYSFWREWLWHRRHFVRRFGIPRGARVLEAACGAGFHTHLFNRMGLHCIGVDRSETGIRWARENYPGHKYYCADIRQPLPLPPESFDVVLTRGCGLYHYDLTDPKVHQATHCLMQYVRPGGLLVLIMVTDLSGRKASTGIWQNTLNDYRNHFAAFTTRCQVDWHKGIAVCGAWKTESPVRSKFHPVSRKGTTLTQTPEPVCTAAG